MFNLQNVETFDIDSLPCETFTRLLDNWSKYAMPPRRLKNRRAATYMMSSSQLGYKVTTLLHRWRWLESRAHHLTARAHKASTDHWDFLKVVSKKAQNMGGTGDVWFVDKNDDSSYVNTFEKESQSLRSSSMDELIKRCAENSTLKAHIASDQDAAMFYQLESRKNTLMRRARVFNSAFIAAIETRLRELVESRGTYVYAIGRRISKQCAFYFSNEGRHYLVITPPEHASGRFQWVDGVFFTG